jgi:hypothetical protein
VIDQMVHPPKRSFVAYVSSDAPASLDRNQENVSMGETVHGTKAKVRFDDGFDPDDFGRRVRECAVDAHRILKRPDSPTDELIALHRRGWFLLCEAPGSQSTPIRRWLLATRQAIAAKLQSWSAAFLELSVT